MTTVGKRRFQFHLSTALAMMLVAGVYFGLNAVPHEDEETLPGYKVYKVNAPYDDELTVLIAYEKYGFPFPFFKTGVNCNWQDFDRLRLAADLFFLLPLLGITWLVAERLLRRRPECSPDASATKTAGRWRFRFHLSTALLMMLIASVFVGLNAIPRETETVDSTPLFFGSSPDVMTLLVRKEYGFPLSFFRMAVQLDWYDFNWLPFAADLCSLLLLLGITCLLSERRRFEQDGNGDLFEEGAPMAFPLLHDPEPLRDTQTWLCKIPVIGWQVSCFRQEANEASLVRQAIDRGPVPESEWQGHEYSKEIRAKLEKIVIANAYPKESTFHPDDPFELMMVLRYGDLNEVEIMMDIENSFGLDFNEELYRRLVEERMTFLQFIRHVESIPASQRTPKSSPDPKNKRLGRILSWSALAWLLLLPISAFFGLQPWFAVPTLLAIGAWLTIRIFGKLRRILRKDLDIREKVFLRIAAAVVGTALGCFLMWQGVGVVMSGFGAVAVWFYALLFISGGLFTVEMSLGLVVGVRSHGAHPASPPSRTSE